jgi:flagellar protein FlbD
MIELTRMGGGPFVVNADQIETVEATPDTVITLVNGHRYIVRESPVEIVARATAFRRRCFLPPSE